MMVVMVRLTVLPHMDIIDGLKGNIDFYVHRGIPCARTWPKSPGKHLSKTVQDSYTQFSTDSGLCGRDLQIRAYLTGLYRYPLE